MVRLGLKTIQVPGELGKVPRWREHGGLREKNATGLEWSGSHRKVLVGLQSGYLSGFFVFCTGLSHFFMPLAGTLPLRYFAGHGNTEIRVSESTNQLICKNDMQVLCTVNGLQWRASYSAYTTGKQKAILGLTWCLHAWGFFSQEMDKDTSAIQCFCCPLLPVPFGLDKIIGCVCVCVCV